MSSAILSGEIKRLSEPKQGNPYFVLDLPSKLILNYKDGTYSETEHQNVKEVVVHVKITELNRIRFPMDANPRKPEHMAVVETIRESALTRDSNLFIYKNNGIDVFCKNIERSGDDHLIIEFGEKITKDGVCNGGLTYYSLQSLENLPDDAYVKVRFYQFDGESIELKRDIAKSKNQNRAVTSSDDANFMGYYDRIKDCLGEYANFVKWETGDVTVVTTERPLTAPMVVRFLSALKIDEPYHWDINPTEHTTTSHKRKRSLLTGGNKIVDDFIESMRGE